jgi:4-hydroxy-2-oxoheptanedioate aldolase
MTKMRDSRVLRKLRAGETASCLKLNIGDGQAAEIASMAGFDCLWIDREHLAQDWSVLNSQIWAAKCHDTDVMVRVSRGSYSDYIKPLEMDATGIMVPHVMSAEDAKQVVPSMGAAPMVVIPGTTLLLTCSTPMNNVSSYYR